jgi:SSS family solute:Na+ symporter
MSANPVALTIFLVLFFATAGLGFYATKMRSVNVSDLAQWGLGGRSFGTLIAWFLLGGDIYTAYTFVAVPALVAGAGATGFFAVPFTILMYPVLFLVMPRLWSVAHKHGYVTAADFVRGRFGSRGLTLAVAATGIVATIPYIALQLMGMQIVFAGIGLNFTLNLPVIGAFHDLPLLVAFVVLAVYTYHSGLHGTAIISVAKGILVYVAVLAAVIVIPIELGGYGKIFAAVPKATLLLAHGTAHNLGPQFSFASLALGSALALWLYPHSITGVFSSSSRSVLKRNAFLLPSFTFALALIALLGVMAVAANVKGMPEYAEGYRIFGNNFAIPALFLHSFSPWFAGVAFAAIGVGALVPAAIMSISCGNLFTRNIYKEFIAPDCTPATESKVAKIMSLATKLFALIFVVTLQSSYAINLQLLGGIWICQTLPSVMLALYTPRRLHSTGLLLGWLAGMVAGTWMAVALNFKGSVYELHLFGWTIPCYAALIALVLNIVIAYVASFICNAMSSAPRVDTTLAEDYV